MRISDWSSDVCSSDLIKGTLGTYDQADLVVTASAPIGDLLRVGGSVARLSRGGFGDNLTTGTENYNKDVWAGRGTVELGGYGAPVLIRISGDYSKDKSDPRGGRSEEHTSELQSLMRTSYAVFCLQKKKT